MICVCCYIETKAEVREWKNDRECVCVFWSMKSSNGLTAARDGDKTSRQLP